MITRGARLALSTAFVSLALVAAGKKKTAAAAPPPPAAMFEIGLDYNSQITWALCLAVLMFILCEAFSMAAQAWTTKQKWWPQACDLQRHMFYNFGYPSKPDPPTFPNGTTDEMCLEGWGFVLTIVVQHAAAGGLMLPVVFLGWDAAGATWRNLFVLGTLLDVGFDCYHWLKTFLTTWVCDVPALKWGRAPVPMFVLMCCLHHPLAMALIIPMNVKYAHLPEYHQIACALLAAAALCYSTGSYKMTLDVHTLSGFRQFKAIMIFQFIVIVYSRTVVWFPCAYRALMVFKADGETGYFYGGCVCVTLMSLFNVALLNDAASGVYKWLPKKPPTEAEAKKLVHELATLASPRGNISQSLITEATVALTPRRKLHAAADAVIAANRMKKSFASKKAD